MANILLFIGGIGFVELFIILSLLFLWLWAIIDLLKSNFRNSTNKLIWAIIIVFLPVLGSILYLLIGRKYKVKREMR